MQNAPPPQNSPALQKSLAGQEREPRGAWSCRASRRAAKPKTPCGRLRVEGAQERDAHQYGVVIAIGEADCTGSAEFELVGIRLIAAVAADQESVEVLDPFP